MSYNSLDRFFAHSIEAKQMMNRRQPESRYNQPSNNRTNYDEPKYTETDIEQRNNPNNSSGYNEEQNNNKQGNSNKPEKKKIVAKMKKNIPRSDDPIFDFIGAKQLIIFFGTSEAGKSYLMIYLLRSLCLKGTFEFGIVFSPTKSVNNAYDFFTNQNLVISGYDENTLKKYMKRLRDIPKEKRPCNFIVFDDCIGDLDPNTKFARQLISTFRHYNITIFMSSQYIKAITPPLYRTQCNRSFVFKMNTAEDYDGCYSAFGSGFPNKKEYIKVLNQITSEKFCSMVYLKEETEPNKKYFSYKAPEEDKIPDVKIKF